MMGTVGRRVRCPNPSPGEAGSQENANILYVELKSRLPSAQKFTCIKYDLFDTTGNMGEVFRYFPLYAASVFFDFSKEASGRRLGERCPSFDGERRPFGASLPLDFPNTQAASFPNGHLLLRSNFSIPNITGTGNA